MNEAMKRRRGLLEMMNTIAMEDFDDEDIYEDWICEGVPDGADTDDYNMMAEDDDMYYQTVELFTKLLKQALEIDDEEA